MYKPPRTWSERLDGVGEWAEGMSFAGNDAPGPVQNYDFVADHTLGEVDRRSKQAGDVYYDPHINNGTKAAVIFSDLAISFDAVGVLAAPFVPETMLADDMVTVYRVQTKTGTGILTGGAFRRLREGGMNIVEANATRRNLLEQVFSSDAKTQLKALYNAQASGAKSPLISTTLSREGAVKALAELKAQGINAEMLTIRRPRSGGLDFEKAFEALGGRTKRFKDADMFEFGISDLFVPVKGKSKSGFTITERQ